MKIAVIIIRSFLGLAFVFFGMNAFLNFMKPPEGMVFPEHAIEFNTALMATGYFKGIGAFEVAGGLLLLTGRFSPLGLALLMPVLVNIVFYHGFIDHQGWQPGAVCAALALFLLYYYRAAFAGLARPFSARDESTFPVR